MALDLSAASNVLKDDYQPVIREQLNTNVMLLAQIESNQDDIYGEEAVLSLHTGRNSGVGARKDGGTLPTAGQQGYTKITVPVKYNYGRIKVTNPTIKAMRSDRGSWNRAVESESKGVVEDLQRDVNRQCYTTSKGTIATISSSANTTSFVVSDKTEARRLEVGTVVDIYSNSYVLQDAGVTITAVNLNTRTITCSALSATASANDIVVRSGVVPIDVASKANEDATDEIHGLDDIASTTEWLHGVNPSATTIWKAYVSAVNAVPSDSVFEEALDEIHLVSGKDANLIITSFEGSRAFANTLKSQKRYANSQDLKGGFKALTVETGRGPVALFAERDCETDVAYLVNTEHLVQYVMTDWEFLDDDGAVLSRVANEAAYEATVYKYHELATDRRNAHGKLTGLTV